jgi:penicillin-binding protein 2
MKMKKRMRVLTTPLVLVLFVFVGTSLHVNAAAKRRAAAKAASKKGKAVTAKSSKSSRRASSNRAASAPKNSKGKVVRSSRRRGAGRVASGISDREAQKLLRKRGKLTRAERKKLSRHRSSRAARARAAAIARQRAIRARDEALRNIATDNIGKDNSVGEDLEIRSAAIQALAGRSGTVVVMDAMTGRVYTVVNQQMALGSPVKPCSTVKMITALAALHENVFDPNEDIQFGRTASMNLTDALARSNNPVFDVLGRELGYENVMKYAENFGFGSKTGINYPGESEGFLPEDEVRLMCSHGTGFGVTAIQLAAFTAAIANGGNLYVPRVPRTAEDAERFKPELRRRIEMSPEDRMRIMAGMIGAVNYGTAKLAYNPLGQVAGKTGTCTGNRDKLGLFTSFSSVDNPRVVVTVITTGSTEAGKRAADIAGRIYGSISPRFFRERMTTPAAATAEIDAPRVTSNMQE